ncbi:hypothetical protein [Azospirillum soli]|uniref:hypothetical protein n=1 Tax=Azospirillum soli TaxID=1304799 RepID=UPI001AE0F037|nr:hypothetical protein [Azospirillum soli]MBP2313252.1 hypothetical protein [Azospirillum soli]
MSHTLLSRRALLGGFAAALALSVAPPVQAAPAPALVRRLVRALPDPAGARAVGAAYLRAKPAEADAARLLRAVAPRNPAGADVVSLRAHLRDLRARDFAAGETIRIGARTYARSEARVCALSVLV